MRKTIIDTILNMEVIAKTLTKYNYYPETKTHVICGKLITKSLNLFTYNLLLPSSGEIMLFDFCDKTLLVNRELQASRVLKKKYGLITKYKEDETGNTYTMFLNEETLMKIGEIMTDLVMMSEASRTNTV